MSQEDGSCGLQDPETVLSNFPLTKISRLNENKEIDELRTKYRAKIVNCYFSMLTRIDALSVLETALEALHTIAVPAGAAISDTVLVLTASKIEELY